MYFLKLISSLAIAFGSLPCFVLLAPACAKNQHPRNLNSHSLSQIDSAISETLTSASTTSTSSSQLTGESRVSGPGEIYISQWKPSNAIQVPGNFIGFGFETAFLNDYTVGTFSENLVNSVAKRLGETLVIRVGGTSGDRFQFNPKQKEAKVCISGDCPAGSSATYVLGPSYFEGFTRFKDQHWTFQARVESPVNYTASMNYVHRAYSAAGADRIDAIAIGNEPDTYDGGKYTSQDYAQAAVKLESRLVKKLRLGNQRIFEVLDSTSGEPFGSFLEPEAFTEGIDRLRRTKYVAQHYYQSPTDLQNYGVAELQTHLMNHSAITARYEQGYLQILQYIQSKHPKVGYVISESGSSLLGPPKNYQDAFGACLWAVDFNLYSMSLGVKRVDSTQRPAAAHSLWVPDTSTNSPNLGAEQNIGPQVRGPYYATPMLADFLGTKSGAIVELLSEDTRTAYALYDSTSGALSKAALVNLKYWSADTGGGRGVLTFSITIGSAVKQVVVKRLHADAGAHAAGFDVQGASGVITWAGETWSYQLDNGNGSPVQGVQPQEVVDVHNGVANIVVPDSEAVIVYISGLL